MSKDTLREDKDKSFDSPGSDTESKETSPKFEVTENISKLGIKDIILVGNILEFIFDRVEIILCSY